VEVKDAVRSGFDEEGRRFVYASKLSVAIMDWSSKVWALESKALALEKAWIKGGGLRRDRTPTPIDNKLASARSTLAPLLARKRAEDTALHSGEGVS
jgi:hypothetical protein